MNSVKWRVAKTYSDILYHKADGIAKVTINRPAKRNAFRPETVAQMYDAFADAREDQSIGVVLLTGAGPHTDGKYAFCSGGDQSVRGSMGYVGDDGVPRLNVLDLQKLIRSMPKVVIALVAGYAIGGGHVLHVVCDLTIAANNAIFGQVGPRMGSFDGGFGSSYLARIVGQKKAREIWYLCRQYNAKQALEMGLVNAVVPVARLEAEGALAGYYLLPATRADLLRRLGRNAEAAAAYQEAAALAGTGPERRFLTARLAEVQNSTSQP